MADPSINNYSVIPPIKVQLPQVERERSIHSSLGHRPSCEVLGPSSCYKCLERNLRKQTYSGLYNYPGFSMYSKFSRVISSDLAAVFTLGKSYPHLSQGHLQHKINQGVINLNPFPKEKERRRKLQTKINQSHMKVPLKPMDDTHNFFIDMDDLRHKIHTGKILKAKPSLKSDRVLLNEKLCPPFLSSRRETVEQKATAQFSPPLFPVLRQNPEPKFFAGQKVYCPLPTPLPIDGEINDDIISTGNGCYRKTGWYDGETL